MIGLSCGSSSSSDTNSSAEVSIASESESDPQNDSFQVKISSSPHLSQEIEIKRSFPSAQPDQNEAIKNLNISSSSSSLPNQISPNLSLNVNPSETIFPPNSQMVNLKYILPVPQSAPNPVAPEIKSEQKFAGPANLELAKIHAVKNI